MEIKQDWNKSNLSFHLREDFWSPYNAFRVLAGLNYFGPEDEFDPDASLDGSVVVQYRAPNSKSSDGAGDLTRMKEMWSIFDSLKYFWENGQHGNNEAHPPEFYIKWATIKGHRPEWLDWATENGLYTPKENAKETDKPIANKERNTLLIIIAALAKEAKIDLSKPSKAGEAIARLTQELGAAVDHSTIEQKIKLIQSAIENRAK